ncbi:PAS domain S-box protein [Chloroflexota bacterium]
MVSVNSPKQTIAGRLWLGFGLLVFVLALSALTYYWQIQRINSDVAQIVEVQEPLEQAISEMHIHTVGITQAVSDYLRTRDPDDVEKVRNSEVGFEIANAQFKGLAQTDESKRLGQEITRLFENFKGTPYRIITLADQQYSTLLLFKEDIKEINYVIGGMLQTTINVSPPDAMKKLEAALNMQDNLKTVSVAIEAYIAEPDPRLQQEILDAQEDFRQFSMMYRETGLSAYEGGWLDHMDAEFEEAIIDSAEVIAITNDLSGFLARFDQSLWETGAYLDKEVRPLVRAQAIEASEGVQASTNSATTALLVLGIIGILIGSASAWVLARKISGPLRDLINGASVVSSGRLHYRFNIDAKGEFGQLAHALNQMLENLGRSKEALGESEELAWTLLDATQDMVILTDRRGVILASNEVAAGRVGKNLEQMIDESLYDLLPDGAAASMKAHMADVIRTGKPVHYQDEREGKITDYNIYPVISGKGEISRIAIFSRDITMRKWVEDVTEQLARRNQLILEAAGQGIYGLDTQGRTTFVNPAAGRMLGYKPEDLIGKNHHELVHHSKPDGKTYPNQECPIYAAFKDGTIHTSVDDEVFWRKDGTSFPVEYTSTPIIEDDRILGAVVTFQDITVRKQVEKALHQNEEKYLSIFESASSLIVSVDKEGVIVDCSARIQQVLGYTPTDIIEQKLVDIVHPDERTKVEELLKEVLTKGFKYDNQYRMILTDGTSIEVSMNAAAVRDVSGEYVRIICMIDRITEVVQK